MEISIHDYGAVLTEVPMIPRAQPVRVSDGMGLYMVGRLMDEAEILHPARDGRGTALGMVEGDLPTPSRRKQAGADVRCHPAARDLPFTTR